MARLSVDQKRRILDYNASGRSNVQIQRLLLREHGFHTTRQTIRNFLKRAHATGTIHRRCSCNNCIVMPTERESRCCKTKNIVDAKAEGLRCITDHEIFAVNCTNIHVLETAYYAFVSENGPMQEGEVIHEVYSYVAYRQFTRWIYHILGKRNRRVIPSCTVTAIRTAFPSEEYAGFKYPQ